VDADLDTLATALYVTTDDLLTAHPTRVPPRPAVGNRTEDQRRRAADSAERHAHAAVRLAERRKGVWQAIT
jgi:phage-related baseplate assembly protein